MRSWYFQPTLVRLFGYICCYIYHRSWSITIVYTMCTLLDGWGMWARVGAIIHSTSWRLTNAYTWSLVLDLFLYTFYGCIVFRWDFNCFRVCVSVYSIEFNVFKIWLVKLFAWIFINLFIREDESVVKQRKEKKKGDKTTFRQQSDRNLNVGWSRGEEHVQCARAKGGVVVVVCASLSLLLSVNYFVSGHLSGGLLIPEGQIIQIGLLLWPRVPI